WGQFAYMLSRNRSTCGVRPYIRGTLNPDPDHWTRSFIDWWIGGNGLAIPERSGVIRYFVNVDDVIHWADTPDELIAQFSYLPKPPIPKSFTFIGASVYDNRILMEADPGYLANLMAMNKVER